MLVNVIEKGEGDINREVLNHLYGDSKDYLSGLHPNREQYARMLKLRELVDSSPELSNVDIRYLHGLLDVINRPKYCIKYWMNRDDLDTKISIINKYNLTEKDVEYMIHYKTCKENIKI